MSDWPNDSARITLCLVGRQGLKQKHLLEKLAKILHEKLLFEQVSLPQSSDQPAKSLDR